MGFGHAAWNVGILQGNVMVLQAPLAFWQGACMATPRPNRAERARRLAGTGLTRRANLNPAA